MASFCNCKPNNPEEFTNKFRVVEVDKDGICLNCGHYTLCTDKQAHYISNVNGMTHNKRNTKHSQEKVDEIRRLLALGERGCDVAEKVGVSRSVVYQIKNGKSRL